MNKKLIAAAVSAAVVAPVASHADAVLYGRINNAIDINDTDGSEDADSTTHLRNVVSRIGVRANAETNSGLGVHGHYEFLAVSDREEDDDGSGIDDTRIATVGVSGGFGRFDVGQQWSAYFNTFGTLVSPTYSLGYYLYSSVGGAPFRASNTIKYSNSFGPVTAQLDVRLNESGEGNDVAEKLSGDGIGLGLSFAVTDNITIAAAFDSEDGADRDEIKAVAYRADQGTAPGLAVAAFTPTVDRDRVDAYTVIGTDGTIIKEVAEVTAQTAGTEVAAVAAVDASDDYIPGVEGVEGHDADEAPDTDRIGIAVKANFGGYWATLGWQNYSVDDDERTYFDDEVDLDTVFLWGGGNFNEQTSWMIGFADADDAADDRAAGITAADMTAIGGDAVVGDRLVERLADAAATDDSSQVTVGIYHNLGSGMRLYYEGAILESENKEWDGARHFLGMRIDF